MENSRLLQIVETTCRHLLSEQDHDPYSPTYGCFDRRYWGWKLADYPEGTFQRNVHPLAWLIKHGPGQQPEMAGVLKNAVESGLRFAIRVQHKDGSFDQAFPHEHSFGATAFLLHSLLEAYLITRDQMPDSLKESVEHSLKRASDFLCGHDETHGMISNHLAGAVLSLMVSAGFFHESRYVNRADELLGRILKHQSSEGWFVEYEGADPGYQTLCLYYLAQLYPLRPDPSLRAALERAVGFLSWFVHPDGTFGGEYGSRRTAVYYTGGLALLSREFPMAASMTDFMLKAILDLRTVTVQDVDMGNIAPLLSNYVLTLNASPDEVHSLQPLPFQADHARQDFKGAGLYIRGNREYYAVLGASNGGVLKVFDQEKRSLVWNDGGYVGQLVNGKLITTQMTDLARPCEVGPSEIQFDAPFFYMLHSTPTPFQFIALRLLNISIMRSVKLGNWVKAVLVNLLISGKRTVPLILERTVKFGREHVIVTDKIKTRGRLKLLKLEFCRPFVAIHMASAKYFENYVNAASGAVQPRFVDVDLLHEKGAAESRVTI
jgi:hypothetical protein